LHMAKKLMALFLAVALLMTGCSISDTLEKFAAYYQPAVPFAEMEYTRPDMEVLSASLDACLAKAQSGESADTVMDAVYEFYTLYDGFSTNHSLAYLHYNLDLTSAYWEKEYTFCAEKSPAADAALEQLFHGLAISPLREELEAEEFFGPGFFDGYEEESVMDETLLALMEQEASLESSYYALMEQYTDDEAALTDALYGEMADLLLRLVRLRREMAEYLGYPDYPSLAYDMYYYRDYTPSQAVQYMQQVAEVLHDPYVDLLNSGVFEDTYSYCSEEETFRYLQYAASAMGGTVADAFDYLKAYDLYDISYSDTKSLSSFEVYIWNYYAPFVFVSPYLDQSDKLSFAHEFGHFAADYSYDGSFAGIDISEVHSQAMEYLTLCYGKNTEELTRYKLADCLCLYVEQSAYGLFEHLLYNLEEEELTAENVTALFQSIGTLFGFDAVSWDPREYVTVQHFYTDPMYIISYVVSNDLALQIYQMELAQSGAGLALYEQILPSQDSYLLAFAESYGLRSPFSDTRLQEVAQLLTEFSHSGEKS